MAQTQLEAIKGGGGSIKVGTTGTINALMSRELKSVKVASNETSGTTSKAKVQTDEASTSNNNNNNNKAVIEKHASIDQKTKHHHARNDSKNPFLRSDRGSTVDGSNGTNNRRKNDKKGSCMVDIVDVKCGVNDKMWVNPITSRLKKLTFSKLSEANAVK